MIFYQANPITQSTMAGSDILNLLNSKNALQYSDPSTSSSYGVIILQQNYTNYSATIGGLLPETNYNINLYAYQMDGTFIDSASKSLSIKTKEAERPFVLSFGIPSANYTNDTYNTLVCSLCTYLSLPVSRLTSPGRDTCNMASYHSRRRLSNEGTAFQQLGVDQTYSDTTTQILSDQATTIYEVLGVEPQYLSNIDPASLATTINNAKDLTDMSRQQFSTNINLYVLSNKTSSVNDVATLVSRINNPQKLSYFYSVMGITGGPYLKQAGAIGGSNSITTIMPTFNKKGVLLRGTQLFVLQAELSLPGLIYAIALPQNSTAPLPFQISQGVDSKNQPAVAAAFNGTTLAVDGSLNPVRVALRNLTANTTYDVYYVPAINVPGDIKVGASVFKVTGKVSGSSSNSTKTVYAQRLYGFGAFVSLIILLVLSNF